MFTRPNTIPLHIKHDPTVCFQGLTQIFRLPTEHTKESSTHAPLEVKTKVTSALVNDILHPGYCAIVTKDLQQLSISLSEATRKFGLTISIKKIECVLKPAQSSTASLSLIQIDEKS